MAYPNPIFDSIILSNTIIGNTSVNSTSFVPTVFINLSQIANTYIPASQQQIMSLSYANTGDLQGFTMNFKRAIPNFGIYNATFTSSFVNKAGSEIRLVYPPLFIVPVISNTYYVRVTFNVLSGSSGTLANAYIGMWANTGDNYNFDGNQVPLTFNNGSSSVVLSGAMTFVSDLIPFTQFNPFNYLIISSSWTGTTVNLPFGTGSSSSLYYFTGAPLTDTGNSIPVPVSQSLSNYSETISLIEILPSNTATLPPTFVKSLDSYLPDGTSNTVTGGYWNLTNYEVIPKMFGAYQIGNSAYDDFPAFNAALYNVFINGSGIINLLNNKYYCSQTLIPSSNTKIKGDDPGILKLARCIINFPVGVGGIRVLPICSGISLEGISLIGVNDPSGATSAHGLYISTYTPCHRVTCVGFSGDGFHIEGYNAPPTNPGLTDLNIFLECCAIGNRLSGFYMVGQDANALSFIRCQAVENGWYGFWDASFLGCFFWGCQAATNQYYPLTTGGNFAVVAYNNINYSLVPVGDQFSYPLANTTTPGTNNSIWYPVSNTNTANNWDANAVYTPGGAFASTDLNAWTMIIACYTEESSNYSWYATYQSQYKGQISGALGEAFIPSRPAIYAPAFVSISNRAANGGGEIVTSTIGTLGSGLNIIRSFNGSVTAPAGFFETFYLSDFWFSYNYTASNVGVYKITATNTTATFGSSNIQPYIFTVKSFGLGNTIISSGNVVPSSGVSGKGWFELNANVSVGSPFGWICTTAGTNGSNSVWQALNTDLTPSLINALPVASSCQGKRGIVTNSSQQANGTNFGSILSVTTGSYITPVYSDGTNWIIG